MQASDKQVADKLDQSVYDDNALVEISIPLNMPYMTNDGEYERYDGSIEFNGIQYNYVKRKISNGALHILCFPNQQKTQLANAKSDYSKQLSDTPSGKKNTESTLKKGSLVSDYNINTTSYNLGLFNTNTSLKSITLATSIADCFIDAPGKPPQTIA